MVLITAERAKPQPCLLSSSQTFTLTSDPQPCPCPVLGLGAVWVSLAALLTSLLCNSPLLSVPTPTLPGLQGTERAPPVSPDPPHRADLSRSLDLCVRRPQGPCPVRSQGRETQICSQAQHAAEKTASGTPTPCSRLAISPPVPPAALPACPPARLPWPRPVTSSCPLFASSPARPARPVHRWEVLDLLSPASPTAGRDAELLRDCK